MEVRRIIILVLISTAPAYAKNRSGSGRSELDCTAKHIAKLRGEAEMLVRAGKATEAIPLLEPKECWLEPAHGENEQSEALQIQIAWRTSDLAFAYYKAGNYESCYSTAASELSPHAGNVGQYFPAEHPVMAALTHNAELCQAAIEKRRGPFADPVACTLDTEDDDGFQPNGLGIPSMVLATDRAACLVFDRSGLDADGFKDCGAVVLLRQTARGSVTRTELAVTAHGNLVDSSTCCNVGDITFGPAPGGFSVLARGGGRDCNGGTALSEEQHLYKLDGNKLELVHAVGAAYH